MFRLLTDEDFNGNITRGLLQRYPNLDLLRVQDAGLMGRPDPEVLERAASEGRILLTHDRNTMPHHATDRIRGGLPMPGVFVVSKKMTVGLALDQLQLILEGSEPGEYANQIYSIPI